jgi:hypothetical protein
MLAADLKGFYLAQPLLTAIFLAMAFAAMVVLFGEAARRLAEPLVRLLRKERGTMLRAPASSHESDAHSSLAYLALLGALALAIAATLYPVLQLHYVGADFPWYVNQLSSIGSFSDAVAFLNRDRGLFMLLLFSARTVTGLSAEDVVRFAPAMLSIMLASSSFLLVKEGTGRLWASSLAALLSVVSAQTTLGMYAGIVANWFALSIANFTFAMIIRSIRLRSLLAAVGSIALSLILLAGYAYLWVVAIVELSLGLVGLVAAFGAPNYGEWKHDVGILSGIILGIVLLPLVFFSIARPNLGLSPGTLDPSSWFALGWRYVQATKGETVALVVSRLGSSVAESRVQLPFAALLSILGLLDHAPRTRSFMKIIGAMVLVPLAIEVVPNAPSYFPLRGLYLIPLYVLVALGAGSVIRRVNGRESAWKSPSALAFAGAFTAYVLLSQLGYTLRMFGLPLLPLP